MMVMEKVSKYKTLQARQHDRWAVSCGRTCVVCASHHLESSRRIVWNLLEIQVLPGFNPVHTQPSWELVDQPY